MDQLIQFINNHIFLVSTFFVISGLLIWDFSQNAKNNIDSIKAIELINNKEAIIIDIRSMADYNKGHILNAINIPANSLKTQLNLIQKYKNKPLIVVCRSGAQSSMACKQLHESDFSEVYNLRGGLLAWEGANMPVTQS